MSGPAYRLFISRPTGENGDPVPVDSSDPSYFRAADVPRMPAAPVDFWDGTAWKHSVLTSFGSYLDDVLGSGATVREILDVAELPDVIRESL